MEQLNWKIQKIKSLNDEVKELHPVLRELFNSMPQIKSVIYTQGNREYGADFILVKEDELLNQDEYVGIVVKSGPIRQTSDDVIRQIRECISMARPIEGGKKSIYLTEVWVVTSKDITRNMEDFLHSEYKSTKLKFIDNEKLVSLITKYFPKYWDFANATVSKYINEQQTLLSKLTSAQRLLPIEVGRIQNDQEITKVNEEAKRRFNLKKIKPTKLFEEVENQKLIFIEGSMGSGKSDLLIYTAQKFCEAAVINKTQLIPYFTTYRDLIKTPDYCSNTFIDSIHARVGDSAKRVVIFIDGLDESLQENSEKVKNICAFANLINLRDDTKLVVASRPIDSASLSSDLAKSFDKYEVCALTFGTVINFVQKICENSSISNKLKEDLQRSPLMRALPRTPLSAILLGRLLKEHIYELPSTLPELYSKYIELVLGRWDLEKGNGSEKEYETLQRLTSMVACHILSHDLGTIGISELREMFKAYLSERRTGQQIEPMLEMFLDRTELISIDSQQGAVRFRHKTFAEFFYAHSLLMEQGRNAPISNPFDPNWYGVEYFYLGLVRDAPDRIEKLAAYIPRDASEEFVKFSQFGSFLMAAYQTPYEKIQSSLYQAFREAAINYLDTVNGDKDSWIRKLPELQLLALFTYLVRTTYGYDFFRPALLDARLEAEMDSGLEESYKVVLIFLLDTVLAALGDESAFKSLVDRHEAQLSWAVRLGIANAARDVEFINEATKRMERKIKRNLSGGKNAGLIKYVDSIEKTPINERKDLVKPNGQSS